MVWSSTRDISQSGVDRGGAGWANFQRVLDFGGLDPVLVNTAVWTFGVVAVTVLISMALAQFLDKAFPGRRLVRLAVIVPWAASVVMTTTVFYYGLDPFYGVINQFLVDIGLLDTGSGSPNVRCRPSWRRWASRCSSRCRSRPTRCWRGWRRSRTSCSRRPRWTARARCARYLSVMLPILRPALAVAVLINIINVFNSLPILKMIDRQHPRLRRRHHHDADLQADPVRPPDGHGECAVGGQLRDRARGDRDLPETRPADAGGDR